MSAHHRLFKQAMGKAHADLRRRGISNISREASIEEAALYITYSTPFTADEVAMLRYWEAMDRDSYFEIPDHDLLEGLARYLNFTDYKTWKASEGRIRTIIPKNKVVVIMIVAFGLVLLIAGMVMVFLMGTVE